MEETTIDRLNDEKKQPREYWLLQHDGDAFIYESLDDFPPDGDKSLLVHVREVIDETKQADTSTRKYEFTGNTQNYDGAILRQIRRISDGEVGGWIESEQNLSHQSDCWVFGNAKVSGNSWVFGDANVSGNACVYGDANVSGDAWVYGNAKVSGDAWVYGNAKVFGDANVSGNACVYGDAWVYGDARVSGGVIR
jgi:hypothetical protein